MVNQCTASDDSVDLQLGLDIPSISDLKEDNTNKLVTFTCHFLFKGIVTIQYLISTPWMSAMYKALLLISLQLPAL